MASICKKVVNGDVVNFDFVDGETIACELHALPDDIITRLALHGLSQKVGDSYAGAESVGEARAMAQGVYDNLVAGTWAVRASRGGKIIEAITRALGLSFDDALTKWNEKSDDEKKAIKNHPSIKVALAEIESERAAKLAEAASDAPELTL